MKERFESAPANFVTVVDERHVFVGVKDRAEFDLLDLPVKDHGENNNGHVLTKVIDGPPVMVTFQHWIKQRTVDAIIEDAEKESNRAQS